MRDDKPSGLGTRVSTDELQAVPTTELQAALVAQNESGKKLGEVLVEKQIVSSDKVNQALTEQSILLGEILVDADLISPEQLDQVLGEQYLKNKKLGELLLEKKLVTSEQLEMTLRKQYWQKNGFWLIS